MISSLLHPRSTVFASSVRWHSFPSSALRNGDNGLTKFPFLVSANSRRDASSSSPAKHQQSQTPSSSSNSSSPSIGTATPSNVNPPASTRPGLLDLPAPLATSASVVEKCTRYIALGRAYYTFFKTGLKNVYHNYRASLPVRRSLGLPVYLPTSPLPSSNGVGSTFLTTVTALNLSRSDFQLVRRSANDVRRIIPFTLILLICGELTPLIIVFLGNAVTPSTCRVPKQLDKQQITKAERKRASFATIQARLGSATPISPGSEEEMQWLAENFADVDFAASASAEQVLQGCAALGLARTHQLPSLLVPLLYRPRLKRWAQYLDLDDRLIVRGGGPEAMFAEELRIALEERGGVGVGAGKNGLEAERAQRQWLERWLARRKLA